MGTFEGRCCDQMLRLDDNVGVQPGGSGSDEAFAAEELDLRCMRTLLLNLYRIYAFHMNVRRVKEKPQDTEHLLTKPGNS